MKDFYYTVRSALDSNTMDELIRDLNADPNIVVSIDPAPVQILPAAFYESQSGDDSLEYIYNRAKLLGIEIPFSGMLNEARMEVLKFFKGQDGNEHFCYWDRGNLLQRSHDYAEGTGAKVSLGHTHPVFMSPSGKIDRAYGAICSKIYYQKEDLEDIGDEISLKTLQSGLYERFGGDYCEMFFRSQEPDTSKFFWIMSPRLEQVGFFRIENEGRVIYHPWLIVH